MSSEPKHREISRYLASEIAARKYPDSRMPSEAQLVRQFKVSRPTVGRAMRDLQEQGLIERRAGSGTYVRQNGSTTMPSTRQLGLLIPGLGTTEIFEIICGELASLARAGEYTLLWGGSTHPRQDKDTSREHAKELCEQFVERKVTGVFFAPFELTEGSQEVNQAIAERFREAGIPVVLLDRDITAFPHRSNFDLVGLDNLAAGCLMAEHLIKLSCERLAFVARPLSAPTVDSRIAGVREAMARHRIDPAPDWVRIGDPQDIKFVRLLLAGHWDAIICANDITAGYLMRSFEQANFSVPRQIRVVGFDDAKYATLLRVPLTTFQQPCREIAITAYHTMLSRIAEPALPARTLLLSGRVVVRESCGAYLPRDAKGLPLPRKALGRSNP